MLSHLDFKTTQYTQAPMKTLLVLAVSAALLNGLGPARAADLASKPMTVVSPPSIDFGAVRRKETATNTFLVENLGPGRLVGRATVAPPFKIISGATYDLTRLQAQIVTVTYTPSGAPTDTQSITFPGGGAVVTATVSGRLSKAPPPHKPPRR